MWFIVFCRKFTDNHWGKSHISQQGQGLRLQGQGLKSPKIANVGYKNGNKIYKLNIHEWKVNNMSISVDCCKNSHHKSPINYVNNDEARGGGGQFFGLTPGSWWLNMWLLFGHQKLSTLYWWSTTWSMTKWFGRSKKKWTVTLKRTEVSSS